MKRVMWWALAAALLVVAVTPPLGTNGVAPAPQGATSVIVMLRSGNDAAAVAGQYARAGGAITRLYPTLNGFAAKLSPAAVQWAAAESRVAVVAVDGIAEVTVTESAATWGLDRIDQPALPLSGTYGYDTSASNVTAFALDTGIRRTHVDFGGRVGSGRDFVSTTAAEATTEDCHGHGTHVAGTIGGATYGVAKGVTLVPVRVLGCTGSGPWSAVIAGLDWAASQLPGTPRVANMSLGGAGNLAVDAAVARAVDLGVTVVVSAGNSGADACSYSPARAPSAVTVGATTSADVKASFSNMGSCVDLFAPGVSIVSDAIASDTATATKSGTSMSAPHVAGIAALLLAGAPDATPASITRRLLDLATPNVISLVPADTANLLAFNGFVPPPPTPPEEPVPDPVLPPPDGDPDPPPPPSELAGAPVLVGVTALERAALVEWSAPVATGSSPVTSYLLRVYVDGVVVKTLTVSAPALSKKVSGLKPSSTYRFTVAAVNAAGAGPESTQSDPVVPLVRGSSSAVESPPAPAAEDEEAVEPEPVAA